MGFFIDLKDTAMLWVSNGAKRKLSENGCIALKPGNDGEFHYIETNCGTKASYICVRKTA